MSGHSNENDVATLAGKPCGQGQPPLLIAELSGNHGGRLEQALAMVDAAARAGADLIKIQTYRPGTITVDHDGPEFRIESGLWQGRTLYELYEEAHTPWDWHAALFERARDLGVPLFSSPFDLTAVDLLESLHCPVYKIASFELVDHGLIDRVAATGKPVIMSTGIAALQEIDEAVEIVRRHRGTPLVLLHCTSAYPAPVEEADLATIPMLAERYRVPVGLSDHTLGIAVPVAAVALGACLIEKHFTLDRSDGAVDAAFSLDPGEFADMAQACRDAARAIGQPRVSMASVEQSQRAFRRSLYAVADIPAGAVITDALVRSVRPGLGLHPRELLRVIGARARVAIAKGTPMAWDLIDVGDDQQDD